MQQNFFKYFSIVLLIAVFWLPQNTFAQSNVMHLGNNAIHLDGNAKQIVKAYLQGQLTNPTAQEKQIVGEYLQSIQMKAPKYPNPVLPIDATYYLNEDFSAPSPLLVDDFDFTGLLTDNGWTAHSGGGTEPIQTTTGLTYTDYPGSGVGNAAGLDNTGEDDNRQFTAVTSGYVYYSALINVTTAPSSAGYFLHLGTGTTTFHSRVYVQSSVNPGKINFGMSNSSSGAVYGTTDFDLGTTYLVIVKSQVANPGTNDVWVLASGVPADEVAAGTPEISTSAGTGLTSITGIYLRQFNSTQNITVDGIRAGTSWGAIFPRRRYPFWLGTE